MSEFRVSQGELWSRDFVIEAETLEQAKEIYAQYVNTGKEPDNMHMYDPEYIEDINGDAIWSDEEGNILS